MDWQDISTAPKDGTELLICYEARSWTRVTMGHWNDKRKSWYCDVGEVPATHWQKIPDPPPAVEPADADV